MNPPEFDPDAIDEEVMSLHDDGPTPDDLRWFLASFAGTPGPGTWRSFLEGGAWSFEGRVLGMWE